eukprot:3461919-Prymnesium_polylepis.1
MARVTHTNAGIRGVPSDGTSLVYPPMTTTMCTQPTWARWSTWAPIRGHIAVRGKGALHTDCAWFARSHIAVLESDDAGVNSVKLDGEFAKVRVQRGARSLRLEDVPHQ